MMGISWQKSLAGCLLILGGLSNCHKEPVLPSSLIPPGCRVAQVEYFDAKLDLTTHSVYTYQYDQSGNRTASNDQRGKRTYTLDDSSRYIISQQVNGVTLTYQYDAASRRINRIAGGALSYDYTYDGNSLKTYVAKEGAGISTYTFANGKLTAVTLPNGETVTVTDGKITQLKKATGDVVNYTYNPDGQLTQTDSVGTSERKLITYTYDTKSFYANSGLFARGIPVLADKGQPGPGFDDIGYAVQRHNYQTVNIKQYRKDATLIADRTLTYTHAYNKADPMPYSTGYARSDGARAKFYYSNCE